MNTTIVNPKTPGALPNGSIFPYLSTNGVWNTLPNNATDPLVSLFQFPDGRAQLDFTPGDGNYSLALPIIAMLLQPNATIVPVWCVYALSGQYDHLARALFYLTLIMAVIFRRSKWVSSAALGSAMAYSALTCIHLFVLLTRFHWGKIDDRGAGWDATTSKPFGDIDFFGIVPVLSASGVMLAPIFTWSTTFRTHEARPVVVAWGLLIFVSLVPALVFLRGFILGDWTLDVPPSLAYCTGAPPLCSWDSLASDRKMTFELYNACGCTDFCGLLSPAAPLRSIQNMAVDLERQISTRAHLKGRYKHFFEVVMVVWVIATAQGLISLLWSHSDPVQVRNFLFQLFYVDRRGIAKAVTRDTRRERFLARHPTQRDGEQSDYPRPDPTTPRPPPGLLSRARLGLASILAATAYLFMICSAVLYPICFIATIVVNELLAANYPVSETWDSVGAWSPWAAAALVLLSALVVHYSGWIAAVGWGLGRLAGDRLRYDRADRPKYDGEGRRGGLGAEIHRRALSGASLGGSEDGKKTEEELDLNVSHLKAIIKDVKGLGVAARKRRVEFGKWWADPLVESRKVWPEGGGEGEAHEQPQPEQGDHWVPMTGVGAEAGGAKHADTEWRPITGRAVDEGEPTVVTGAGEVRPVAEA